MLGFLSKLLLVVRSRLKSRARLEAENIVLRQQALLRSIFSWWERSRSSCSMPWSFFVTREGDWVMITVTSNPTAERVAGHVTDAFPWDEAPRHLIRDRDGAFGPAYTRRIRAMRIRDHPTAARSPCRTDTLSASSDRYVANAWTTFIVFGEAHLRGVLKAYASYYNQVRTHLSLDKNAPDFRRAQPDGRIAALPVLGGLHHRYVRV
jgi:hypothetical protein